MNKGLAVLGGIGLGAGLMYLFDPNSGKRRRAQINDKATHLTHAAEEAVGKATRDFNNRAHGAVARTRASLSHATGSDEVIAARIRARLGRYVSHPHAVEVYCEGGRVTLSGPILASEVDGLLDAVLGIKGVTDVINWLEIHHEAGNIPALQGGRVRSSNGVGFAGVRWTPAARLTAGVFGGGIAAYTAFRGRGITKLVDGARPNILSRLMSGVAGLCCCAPKSGS